MTVEELQVAMEAAAAALDFESASKLRDRLALLRQAGVDPGEGAESLARQQPGAMGIGSNKPRPITPANWVKPPKPDPMTKGRSRKR